MASSFTRFLDHTQRRSTVGRTHLDEWSARRSDLYLTTHNTHNRQISMPPVGFEPTFSARERPQTYTLDRAATATGSIPLIVPKNKQVYSLYIRATTETPTSYSGGWSSLSKQRTSPTSIAFPPISSAHTFSVNPLNPELNPICYLLALLGAHHFLHVSRIRVKLLTFRLLMSYIYGAPILDVSRSHTTTHHSR